MKNERGEVKILDDELVPQFTERIVSSNYSLNDYLKIIGFTSFCFYLLYATTKSINESCVLVYSSRNRFLLNILPLVSSLSGIFFLMLVNIFRGNYFKLRWKFWVIGFTFSYYLYIYMTIFSKY